MKVYEAIIDCTISYRDKSNTANDFVLYVGDLIFIEPAGWNRDGSRTSWSSSPISYVLVDKLSKIYHNKWTIDGSKVIKEWTWINDINVIDPLIDTTSSISDALVYKSVSGSINPKLKDVTTAWSRDEIITNLGI